MSKVRGRFYFRLTDNGNLVGEFSNDQSTHSQPESAERTPPSIVAKSPCSFIGTYQSTWFEPSDNRAILAQLEITPKLGAQQLFDLKWLEPGTNHRLFLGQAMIGENLLIGNYWQA